MKNLGLREDVVSGLIQKFRPNPNSDRRLRGKVVASSHRLWNAALDGLVINNWGGTVLRTLNALFRGESKGLE